MIKEENKKRFGLTLLLAVLVFVIEIVAIAIAVGIIVLLMQTGIVEEFSEDLLEPSDTLLMMSVISLIIGAILSGFASKLYLQPVNRFINQMNRLAAGDFKARIHFGKPIASHASFREIEDSFNKMARELESTEMLRSDFIKTFPTNSKPPLSPSPALPSC